MNKTLSGPTSGGKSRRIRVSSTGELICRMGDGANESDVNSIGEMPSVDYDNSQEAISRVAGDGFTFHVRATATSFNGVFTFEWNDSAGLLFVVDRFSIFAELPASGNGISFNLIMNSGSMTQTFAHIEINQNLSNTATTSADMNGGSNPAAIPSRVDFLDQFRMVTAPDAYRYEGPFLLSDGGTFGVEAAPPSLTAFDCYVEGHIYRGSKP